MSIIVFSVLIKDFKNPGDISNTVISNTPLMSKYFEGLNPYFHLVIPKRSHFSGKLNLIAWCHNFNIFACSNIHIFQNKWYLWLVWWKLFGVDSYGVLCCLTEWSTVIFTVNVFNKTHQVWTIDLHYGWHSFHIYCKSSSCEIDRGLTQVT